MIKNKRIKEIKKPTNIRGKMNCRMRDYNVVKRMLSDVFDVGLFG